MDTKALFSISYGLFVLTTVCEGKDNGCIINTVSQVANMPNRLAFSVSKANHTHDMLKTSGVFTVSVISEQADFSLFERFGFHSGREVNKFADFPHTKRTETWTLAVTKDTCAYLSGNVLETVDLGSHTLFIADIVEMEVLSAVPPATYAYYHAHIKPKKEAPKTDKTVWRCKICGYEYEGETLPEDYICPICKHPASDFEKVSG